MAKRAYLVDALVDKAKEFVGDLIQSEADFNELWRRLTRYFGNKRYVKKEAINAIFSLESPTEDNFPWGLTPIGVLPLFANKSKSNNQIQTNNMYLIRYIMYLKCLVVLTFAPLPVAASQTKQTLNLS